MRNGSPWHIQRQPLNIKHVSIYVQPECPNGNASIKLKFDSKNAYEHKMMFSYRFNQGVQKEMHLKHLKLHQFKEALWLQTDVPIYVQPGCQCIWNTRIWSTQKKCIWAQNDASIYVQLGGANTNASETAKLDPFKNASENNMMFQYVQPRCANGNVTETLKLDPFKKCIWPWWLEETLTWYEFQPVIGMLWGEEAYTCMYGEGPGNPEAAK